MGLGEVRGRAYMICVPVSLCVYMCVSMCMCACVHVCVKRVSGRMINLNQVSSFQGCFEATLL